MHRKEIYRKERETYVELAFMVDIKRYRERVWNQESKLKKEN